MEFVIKKVSDEKYLQKKTFNNLNDFMRWQDKIKSDIIFEHRGFNPFEQKYTENCIIIYDGYIE